MKNNQQNDFSAHNRTNLERTIHRFFTTDKKPHVYPKSITISNNHSFFIARSGHEKNCYIVFTRGNDSLARKFSSHSNKVKQIENETFIMCCPLNHENALVIQELFDFTRPVLIGTENSFGFGDRLGLANPGHVRAIAGTTLKPIFAQQSIRELRRTMRTPEDVMDAAVWAVFQEGYHDGFGADADHLKTTEDIDVMACAGFTMFTFDPGAFVDNDADSLPSGDLYERLSFLSWNDMDDTFEDLKRRYADTRFTCAGGYTLEVGAEEVARGIVKYGNVIAHTVKMFRHLNETYSNQPHEVELSVDETDSPTSPFEHFLIANELKRRGIPLVSLAPRFIGDFEKGIDYRGNLEQFKTEYRKHLSIAKTLGPYKLSLHSGSDKFSIYDAIGTFREGHVHIKTAGTSYLVALQTIAFKDTPLFREILNFSRDHYEAEKMSYHVSADIRNVPEAGTLTDEQCGELIKQNDARQVLHVTFGKVLTSRTPEGKYLFRDRIMRGLTEHEDTHYELLRQHFERHINPFV